MKKFALIMLVVMSLGIIMSSCQSSQKCAAYGEASRYKVDRNR
jgi:hypothetical protein